MSTVRNASPSRSSTNRAAWRWKVVVPVGSVALLAALGMAWRLHPEEPERAAARVMSCTLDGDANCLMGYVSSHEREALKLDSTKLRKFLETFVRPRLSGFKTSGPPRFEKFYGGEVTSMFQDLAHPDGRRTEFVLSVGSEKGHLCCSTLVTSLASTAIVATVPADKPIPRGRDNALLFGTEIEGALDRLASTGIDGILLGNPPNDAFLTWRQYADRKLTLARSK